MSIWTHVTGAVRIDTLTGDTTDFAKILQAFGKTCTFNSPPAEWEACTVPMGSEGSIQYLILEVDPPEKDEQGILSISAARWVVVIWGDLRSFGKEDFFQISQWLKRASENLKSSGLHVRQSSVVAVADDGEPETFCL